MTGYELLEYELIKEFSKSKILSNRPLIQAVVKILAEQEDRVALDLAEQKHNDAVFLLHQERKKEEENRQREIELKIKTMELSQQSVELEKREKEIQQMMELETPETRDRVRLSRIYKDSIEINTCYDNTAYIKGVGAILSGKELDDVQDEKE